MIYVGHFSFKNGSQTNDGNDNYGHFTIVAEAKSIEHALDKFRTFLRNLKNEGDVLDGINDIFLEACVECKHIPDEGFLSYYEISFDSMNGKISTAGRGATDEQVVVYGYGSDESEDRNNNEMVPFLVLD